LRLRFFQPLDVFFYALHLLSQQFDVSLGLFCIHVGLSLKKSISERSLRLLGSYCIFILHILLVVHGISLILRLRHNVALWILSSKILNFFIIIEMRIIKSRLQSFRLSMMRIGSGQINWIYVIYKILVLLYVMFSLSKSLMS